MKKRCHWCGNDPLYVEYHDCEWGVPVFDDQKLFEFLILEGMQAGLSWITILRKREHYRTTFDNFDAEKIARYSPKKIEQLLKNENIIRNRLKVESIVTNARCYLELKHQTSLSDFLWQFTDGKVIHSKAKEFKQIPTETIQSQQMSKELKKLGFKFVGSTICYAFMQAVGMVNDHVQDCFRYKELKKYEIHSSK